MTAHVSGTHVRIAAREGKGERVVLDVGPENDALGERVDGRGRGSRTLQLASGQGALADVADGDAASFRRAAGPHARMIRVVRSCAELFATRLLIWSREIAVSVPPAVKV